MTLFAPTVSGMSQLDSAVREAMVDLSLQINVDGQPFGIPMA